MWNRTTSDKTNNWISTTWEETLSGSRDELITAVKHWIWFLDFLTAKMKREHVGL